jgi:O-antigen ligase
MRPKLKTPKAGFEGRRSCVAMACFGAFLGLALLKFGNPAIMEKWVTPPANVFEFVLSNPWPLSWGYVLLALSSGVAFSTARWPRRAPLWVIGLPAAWLLWQFIAGAGTINAELTKPVLVYFTACIVCFYVGLLCSYPERSLAWLLPGLLGALFIVIAAGWQQHFGGLEQTRRYFFLYLYPKLKEVQPEYLKKLSSPRIFSTLFYPNALAGALILLVPALLQFIWQARTAFTAGARIFLIVTIGAGALGCLYWSGSKGGWLLTLVLCLLWLLRRPLSIRTKQALVAALLVLGLAGFFWKYSGFFQKGATSVGARFDYWTAAAKNSMAHPLTGTGPGTFFVVYQKLKRPESEMSRLAHNDYLQQASDSGLPGFALYFGFILSALVLSYPATKSRRSEAGLPSGTPGTKAKPAQVGFASGDEAGSTLWFALWLGTLGWALQSFVEFGLYLPALAWPGFAFLGCLLRRRFENESV